MAERRRVCVCTAQVPFVRGGAELLVDNLVVALRAAGHEAEAVRIPVAWSREAVLPSALAWRLVDMAADVVIATNFPSYFVRHPRKVVWLLHQHRSAYDAADAGWSDLDLSPEGLSIQQTLTDWDTRVLEEAIARFSISREVAGRLARFNGMDATPLYHPAPLQSVLAAGDRADYGDYLFCASRLEANKRMDLAIQALAESGSGMRLVIAGEGSQRPRLEELVRRLGLSRRVDLVGFVDDARLVRLFQEARAVIYPPYQEDYGYVTLQAFAARKPVVTTSDAGGVLEWVEAGESGAIGDPDPASLGRAIDRVAGARIPELRAMGERGYERVRSLRWEDVVGTLMRAAGA